MMDERASEIRRNIVSLSEQKKSQIIYTKLRLVVANGVPHSWNYISVTELLSREIIAQVFKKRYIYFLVRVWVCLLHQ